MANTSHLCPPISLPLGMLMPKRASRRHGRRWPAGDGRRPARSNPHYLRRSARLTRASRPAWTTGHASDDVPARGRSAAKMRHFALKEYHEHANAMTTAPMFIGIECAKAHIDIYSFLCAIPPYLLDFSELGHDICTPRPISSVSLMPCRPATMAETRRWVYTRRFRHAQILFHARQVTASTRRYRSPLREACQTIKRPMILGDRNETRPRHF